MTEALIAQRRVTVGPQGSPTSIGEFHQTYPGTEQLFHSYCGIHGDFGICGTESEAYFSAQDHLTSVHGIDLLGSLPTDAVLVTREQLAEEFEYRLRLVVGSALLHHEEGGSLPEGVIEEHSHLAVDSLAAKAKGE